MPKRPPHILFLLTDQQRWDTIAAAGFDHMVTPHLDRLASRGSLFTHAFCNSPVCMPSRMSLFSGRYPGALGCTCNGIEMPADVSCLQHVLGEAGYHTANLGKLHFLNHANRDHRRPHPKYGFDRVLISDEPGCYEDAYIEWVRRVAPDHVESCRCSTPPAWIGAPIRKRPRDTHEPYTFEGPEHLTHTAFVAQSTIDFLHERVGRHPDQPFFCVAGFYAPHCPLNPPARFLDRYDPATLPPPAMRPGDADRLGLSPERWRVVRQHYYALVSHVDDQIGRVLNALDELGVSDQTVVVFSSDHGERLGDHGKVQKGPPGLDHCARVPLIVSWPGALAAGRRDELIELVDLAPTLVELAGLPVPVGFQGRSFAPLLRGQAYEPRASALLEHREPGGPSWKTIRTRTHRYCSSGDGRELLFDLERDPHELRDVAADPVYAAVLSRMRVELARRWHDAEAAPQPRTGEY